MAGTLRLVLGSSITIKSSNFNKKSRWLELCGWCLGAEKKIQRKRNKTKSICKKKINYIAHGRPRETHGRPTTRAETFNEFRLIYTRIRWTSQLACSILAICFQCVFNARASSDIPPKSPKSKRELRHSTYSGLRDQRIENEHASWVFNLNFVF